MHLLETFFTIIAAMLAHNGHVHAMRHSASQSRAARTVGPAALLVCAAPLPLPPSRFNLYRLLLSPCISRHSDFKDGAA